jgi:zinc protease
MKTRLIILGLFLSTALKANVAFLDSVKRMSWDGLDVVWVEDSKFPKFTASIYFADGALSDDVSGLTQVALDQLTSGTSKQSEKEIADFFDFYGASIRNSVTHEYSVLTVQALTKDINPVMGKVCELFNEASYPQDELASYKSRSQSRLKNLVTNHAALADRVFRTLTLKGTDFEVPADGTLRSLSKINSEMVKSKLKKLSDARKVLYLAGPKDVFELKNVITQKCNWRNLSASRRVTLKKPDPQSSLYLVPVSGANQAQIRIGRYLSLDEIQGKHDQFHFLGAFLGGGFTSKLVQELRVKRGLTYSAGAYVALQRDYARAGVMTFTKNETATDVLKIVSNIFEEVSDTKKISLKEFQHEQGHQIGGYAFGFEEIGALLGQIMLYDHQNRKLEELVKFPQTIANLKPDDLSNSSFEVFPWNKMVIVIVGDRKLEKSLSQIRPVKILNYEDFL